MKSIEKKRMLFKILVLSLLLAFLGVNSYAVDVVEDNSTNSTSSDEISSDIAVTDSTNNTPDNEVPNPSETPDPSETPNPSETPDPSTPGDSQNSGNANLTDFSNATFKVVKDGRYDAALEITGVASKSESWYQCLITSTDTAPAEIDSNTTGIVLSRHDDSSLTGDITKYVELNQDLYVSIYEDKKLCFHGKKLERFAEPKYSDAFFATFLTYDASQIVMNFTSSDETLRKMQVKIGRITDTSILQKIKNQDSSGFADLLNFAKSSSGLYDQVLQDPNENRIAYDSSHGVPAINVPNVVDDAYYYLYVKSDDENGKYIPQEAVTLALSNVYDDGAWYMFFYGSNDFKWADFGNVSGGGEPSTGKEDPTTSNNDLPFTGKNAVITTSLIVLLVLLVYFKRKNDYFDGIK